MASLRPGDAVVAVVSTGAFAAEAVAPEVACWALPPGVDVAAAAGLPIAFGTAHVALALRAGLRPGQVVLVLGAAGGVGLAAVALTKLMGGTVVAVAAGAAKGAAVRAAGADFWVDSADPKLDLRSAVKAVVPSGVDILFDTVGGRAFSAGIRLSPSLPGRTCAFSDLTHYRLPVSLSMPPSCPEDCVPGHCETGA